MFSKIDVTKIFCDHLSTLKNYRTNKAHLPDYFIFFIVPLLITIILIHLDRLLSKDLVNILITSFSIFAGLLLNLLLLVFDISDKSSNNDVIKDALKELYINISFCILLSITIIIFLLAYFLLTFNNKIYVIIMSFSVYYFLFVFIFTLLMILKRIYRILSQRFNKRV